MFLNVWRLTRPKLVVWAIAIMVPVLIANMVSTGSLETIASALAYLSGGILVYGFLLDPKYLTAEGLRRGEGRQKDDDAEREALAAITRHAVVRPEALSARIAKARARGFNVLRFTDIAGTQVDLEARLARELGAKLGSIKEFPVEAVDSHSRSRADFNPMLAAQFAWPVEDGNVEMVLA